MLLEKKRKLSGLKSKPRLRKKLPEAPTFADLPTAEIEKQCQRTKQWSFAYDLPGIPYKSSLAAYPMVTGCGLYAMIGISVLGSNKLTPEFLANLKKQIDEKAGKYTLIAALGDSWMTLDKTNPANYSYEKNMAALGFRKLVSYHNYNHGEAYMQTMFIREVNG